MNPTGRRNTYYKLITGIGKFIKRGVNNYIKRRELFESGVMAADNEDFRSAFDFYRHSLLEREDPSPYLNRARIF